MGTSSETTKKADRGASRNEQERTAAAATTLSDGTTDGEAPRNPTRAAGNQPPSAPYDQHVMPNIHDLQPQRRSGDFDRDLMPGGSAVDDATGNLMGPNHPAFRGDTQPATSGGGYGMRPRFDPFGPPGGPTDPRNLDPSRGLGDPTRNPQLPRQPRQPPGGSGDPNPDHERPPNDLNNNMFM